MSGAAGVMKGLSPVVRTVLVIAAFLAVVTTFNIFTEIHDAAEHGQTLAVWEPATWEYTSALSTMLCSGIAPAVSAPGLGAIGV